MMNNSQNVEPNVAGLKHILQNTYKHRINSWLSRRIPAADHHKLTRRNIFILPTRFGIAFIVFILTLFLMATNYQNNIIMLFSYVMASAFLTAMMTSFYNLSGLIIKAERKSSGHADTPIHFTITADSDQRRYDLNFNFDGQENVKIPLCKLRELGKNPIRIPFISQHRGRHSPGRLKVSSEYCFGLFITWTHLDFNFSATVYPKVKVIKGSLPALAADSDSSEVSTRYDKGNDDFYELKSYQQGEPLSRIAWKQLAKGQGRFSKHFQQNQGRLSWLRLQDMPAMDTEIKLQLLCFLIIEHSKVGQSFGLDLGQKKIPPAQGIQHMSECLTALADHPRAKR